MIARTPRRVVLVAAAAAVAASAVAVTSGSAGASDAPCGCSAYPTTLDGGLAGADALGARLQQVLGAADEHGNLVFSPLSIEVALAMASAGAGGDTLAQMNEVLGLSGDDPHAAVAELVDAIVAGGEGSLELANSLWAQSGFSTEQSFLDVLSEVYGSELHDVDFRADAGGARDEINAWVDDVTAGRIPELLSPDAIDELTRFVIVNAVHLDADWVSPFEPESTFADTFTTGAGDDVEVETMHQTLHAGYSEAAGAQAITLPYTAGYEMVVVLPEADGLDEFEQALVDADGDLDGLLGASTSTEVVLALPTWDIETATSLAQPLQELGLVDAFDPDLADFTGVTTEEPIFVSDVVHQANITVDEAGTEAAAATAVVQAAGAAPGPQAEPVEMTVDRPFFFAIRDQDTGTVLFQGHVNDPS